MSQQQYRRNLRLINWLSGLNNASFFVPFTDNSWRATVNSCATLVARGLYFVAGPLVGTAVDAHGVQSGYVLTGLGLAALLILPVRSLIK